MSVTFCTPFWESCTPFTASSNGWCVILKPLMLGLSCTANATPASGPRPLARSAPDVGKSLAMTISPLTASPPPDEHAMAIIATRSSEAPWSTDVRAKGAKTTARAAVTCRSRMRLLLIVALAFVGCGPAAIPRPSASLPAACGASHGGSRTAPTQLRFVEASDTQVVLTFGASSASNDFDVPAFRLEPLEGTTAPRAYRLRIDGTSSLNPDGTSSYGGLRTIEPGGRTVRGITFVDEAAAAMSF